MKRQNVTATEYPVTSINIGKLNGKFRSLYTTKNLMFHAECKRGPEEGVSNPSFYVNIYDEEVVETVRNIESYVNSELQKIEKGSSLKPVIRMNQEDDDDSEDGPVKKRRCNPSMRVKVLSDTRVIDSSNQDVPISRIMRGSALALSVQPKYLFKQTSSEPYSLSFSVSLVHVRPSKDQMPTFLLDSEKSNETTVHLQDFNCDNLTLGPPNMAAHRMLFADWSKCPKIQFRGKNRFGFDIEHEYNRNTRATYSLNCDEETVEHLSKIDELTESQIAHHQLFDKTKWTHKGVVNRQNEKWPRVITKVVRGRTTVHKRISMDSKELVSATLDDLKEGNLDVIILGRPSCLSASTQKKIYGTRFDITNIIINPCENKCEEFDASFLNGGMSGSDTNGFL